MFDIIADEDDDEDEQKKLKKFEIDEDYRSARPIDTDCNAQHRLEQVEEAMQQPSKNESKNIRFVSLPTSARIDKNVLLTNDNAEQEDSRARKLRKAWQECNYGICSTRGYSF